jgi:hypothetical protein
MGKRFVFMIFGALQYAPISGRALCFWMPYWEEMDLMRQSGFLFRRRIGNAS